MGGHPGQSSRWSVTQGARHVVANGCPAAALATLRSAGAGRAPADRSVHCPCSRSSTEAVGRHRRGDQPATPSRRSLQRERWKITGVERRLGAGDSTQIGFDLEHLEQEAVPLLATVTKALVTPAARQLKCELRVEELLVGECTQWVCHGLTLEPFRHAGWA